MLETFENMWASYRKHCLRNKNVGNIFGSWNGNFVSATMFPEVGKQGNINKKHDASATMFPSLPGALQSQFNSPNCL